MDGKEVKKQLEKQREKEKTARKVIRLILYFATRQQKEFPSRKSLIFLELILAAGSYLSKDDSGYQYGKKKAWEHNLKFKFKSMVRSDSLTFDLRIALEVVSDFEIEADRWGVKLRSDFFNKFYFQELNFGYGKTTSLPEDFLEKAKKNKKEMDSESVKMCREIGERMTYYIKRDLQKKLK